MNVKNGSDIRHSINVTQHRGELGELYFNHQSFKLLEFIQQNGWDAIASSKKTYDVPKNELNRLLQDIGRAFYISPDVFVCLPMPDGLILPKDVGSPDFQRRGIVFDVYAKTIVDCTAWLEKIEARFSSFARRGRLLDVTWAVRVRDEIQYVYISESLFEDVLSEAYPYLKEPLVGYAVSFARSNAPLLIMMGPPGTGKTRLAQHLVGVLAAEKQKSASVLYSMDPDVFGSDNFFVRFLSSPFDALVLEDIDLHLLSRKEGNQIMHKFLAASDGFVPNRNKKIILTTNLRNIREIDEALLRKGRAFDIISTRSLTESEANILLAKLGKKLVAGGLAVPLCNIYNGEE